MSPAAVIHRVRLRRKKQQLPVNRRVDEHHHLVTADGLGVWFTIQVSAHARIFEALFERTDTPPGDEEIAPWLTELMPGRQPVEAPGLPGGLGRRFEVFDHSQTGKPEETASPRPGGAPEA